MHRAQMYFTANGAIFNSGANVKYDDSEYVAVSTKESSEVKVA